MRCKTNVANKSVQPTLKRRAADLGKKGLIMKEHTPSLPVPAVDDRPIQQSGCPECGHLEWIIFKGRKSCASCDYDYPEEI